MLFGLDMKPVSYTHLDVYKRQVRQVLDGLEDIAFCEFKNADVVRHSLVARIVAAYARAEEMNLRL